MWYAHAHADWLTIAIVDELEDLEKPVASVVRPKHSPRVRSKSRFARIFRSRAGSAASTPDKDTSDPSGNGLAASNSLSELAGVVSPFGSFFFSYDGEYTFFAKVPGVVLCLVRVCVCEHVVAQVIVESAVVAFPSVARVAEFPIDHAFPLETHAGAYGCCCCTCWFMLAARVGVTGIFAVRK